MEEKDSKLRVVSRDRGGRCRGRQARIGRGLPAPWSVGGAQGAGERHQCQSAAQVDHAVSPGTRTGPGQCDAGGTGPCAGDGLAADRRCHADGSDAECRRRDCASGIRVHRSGAAARQPDQLATRFIKLIAKLYAAEARSTKWDAGRRRRLRKRYSIRVLGLVEKLLVEYRDAVVPGSLLGKALQYLRGQWSKLIRYVENGDWPISNNLCENAIRPFVVSRRGWLFSDTVDGANASANLYSLVETCKANRIEPYRYLTWLFRQLPLAKTVDDYDALLPWNMPAELR